MRICALNSESLSFKDFIDQIKAYKEVEAFEDKAYLLSEVNQFDLCLLDAGMDRMTLRDYAQKIRKGNPGIQLVYYNSTDSEMNWKRLQISPEEKDVLVNPPYDLDQIFDFSIDIKKKQDTRTVALSILEQHSEKPISGEEKKLSDEIDRAFEGVFKEDYLDKDKVSMSDKKKENLEEDLSSISFDIEHKKEESLNELDLDLDSEIDLEDEDQASEVQISHDPSELDLSLSLSEKTTVGEAEAAQEDDVSEVHLKDEDESESQVFGLDSETEVGESFDVTKPVLQEELDSIMDGEALSETEDSNNLLDEDLFGLSSNDDEDEQDSSLANNEAQEDDQTRVASSSEASSAEDPLDDIKTKMLEIDQLLLGDQADEKKDSLPEENEIETEDELFSDNEENTLAVATEEPESMELVDERVDSSGNNRSMNSEALTAQHREYQENYQTELIRLGETIKSLREDRNQLQSKLQEFESHVDSEKRDFKNLEAQLEEKKIELAIVKKRYAKQIDELNIKLDLIENKKEVLEQRNINFEKEFEKLRREKSVDINQVRRREKELEEKLELLKNDAEVQIRNRDHKILELKRRIDTLEFDIESATMQEKKTVHQQHALEEKMSKVIKTLRNVIGQMEDENSLEQREKNIKKNLDV
ncbi:MAG: hypothetical protein QF441_13480 [Bacteriovoracaceae bacterium]|jgi:hypothetical protein|nr:hypothetical protein [Halobacteriovoraceae bacterium]MDP7321617.1 hypothetical protein [Bacteriovoracaceae bacterium]